MDIDAITAEELEEFEDCIARCPGRLPVREDAIVISFDGNWWHFIGDRRGFNPEDDREHFAEVPRLLVRVIGRWKRHASRRFGSRPGGRAFIDSEGAYYKDPQGQRYWIMKWSLPRPMILLK